MKYIANIHAQFIDKRIEDVKKDEKFAIPVGTCTHEAFVKAYSSNVFTNFIRDTFTASYMSGFTCADCKAVPAEQRCHGQGEERPKLIYKALQNVWPDTSQPIYMRDIMVEFLELHKTTNFTFKCTPCHLAEGRKRKRGSNTQPSKKSRLPHKIDSFDAKAMRALTEQSLMHKIQSAVETAARDGHSSVRKAFSWFGCNDTQQLRTTLEGLRERGFDVVFDTWKMHNVAPQESVTIAWDNKND